jgi:predicted transcriptional regulator of viral defense system
MGECSETRRGADKSTISPDRRCSEIATRQHGVISLAQLREVGLSADQVTGRVAEGRLHRLHRGVYAVGHDDLSRLGVWKAATLVAPAMALSHRSAAGLWQMMERRRGLVHVTGPRRVRASGAIAFHHAQHPADELTTLEDIPVTSVARTLLDIAATEGRRPFERALREAEFRRLTDPLGLPALLERYPRRRGTAIVRQALEARTFSKRTRSELEAAFLDFLVERRIELPETNTVIEVEGRRFEVDCLWRSQRVIAELDGRAAHLIPEQVEADLLRDGLLQANGIPVHRVSPRRLERDRDGLESQLRTALASGPA